MTTRALTLAAMSGPVPAEAPRPVPLELARVRAAQAGDTNAFRAVYEAHVGRVRALCLRMSGDPARADELTQDVFVRVWERLGTFRGESAFGTWLHRIAVNEVLQTLRATGRRERRVAIVAEPPETAMPGGVGPEESMDLEQAISQLPDACPDGVRPARRGGTQARGDRLPHRDGGRHQQGAPLPRPAAAPPGARPMTCDFARDRLDAYAAGSLAPAERDAMRAHLDTCAECTADLEAARFLAPRTAALPREAPPDPALWPRVEARLTPRRSESGQALRIVALAAALLLAVGTGWWLRGYTTQDSRLTTHDSVRYERQPYETEVASLRAAMNDLERALVDGGKLPAPVSESFRRDLRVLESAITEASAALTADPANEALRELYRAAFRRKLEALRRAAAVYAET